MVNYVGGELFENVDEFIGKYEDEMREDLV